MARLSDTVGATGTDRSGVVRRSDIQAMRALAVVLVLVYHLWPWLLPGGFVGVDVFFVISGFLITGNLVREVRSTSRIRLWSFWARRVARLFPAALTVLAFVILATRLWVPPALWEQFSRQIIGSVLYVQNWVLASDAVGYWTSQNLASPVQHYWTLSVEEQFYIGLPILLAILVGVRRRSTWVLPMGLFTVTVASLVWSVWFTAVSRSAAYFVTTTRVWEFGVGALLVWVPAVRRRGAATALFVGGVVAAVAAATMIDATWEYPSYWAAWPVAAAAAMLVGGGSMTDLWQRAVALRPVQYIGGVSYALYLWHWPLIILLPFATGHALTGAEKLGVVAASLLAAEVVTRCVERPVRYSPRLFGTRSPGFVLALGAAGAAVIVASSALFLRSDPPSAVDDAHELADLEAGAPGCVGALAGLDRDRCGTEITRIVPDPDRVSFDGTARDECWSEATEFRFDLCSFGPADGTLRVLVVGDSHSDMYVPAYERIATARGWSIDAAGHTICPWSDAVYPHHDTALYTETCEAWKDRLEEHLAASAPYDVIIVTGAHPTDLPRPADGLDAIGVAVNGFGSAWQRQTDRGVRVIAVRDVPTLQPDVVACVSTHRNEANIRCTTPRVEALFEPEPLLVAAATWGVPVVDLTDIFCDETTCIPVIGNVLAYRDADHLTETFATTLETILADRIAVAVDRR